MHYWPKRFAIPRALLPASLLENRDGVRDWKAWLRIVPESSTRFRCAVARQGTTSQTTDFAALILSGNAAQELLEHASRLRGCAAPEDVSENRSAHWRSYRRLPSLLDGTFVGSYNLTVDKRAIPASLLSSQCDRKEVRQFNWHLDREAIRSRYRAVGSSRWYVSKDKTAAETLLQDVEEVEAVQNIANGDAGLLADGNKPLPALKRPSKRDSVVNNDNDNRDAVDDDEATDDEPNIPHKRRIKAGVIDYRRKRRRRQR